MESTEMEWHMFAILAYLVVIGVPAVLVGAAHSPQAGFWTGAAIAIFLIVANIRSYKQFRRRQTRRR